MRHLTSLSCLCLAASTFLFGCRGSSVRTNYDTASKNRADVSVDTGASHDTAEEGRSDARDAESVDLGSSDVLGDTETADVETYPEFESVSCTEKMAATECLEHLGCTWSEGACQSHEPFSGSAQPLSSNVTGKFEPILWVRRGSPLPEGAHRATAHLTHAGDLLRGYLLMEFGSGGNTTELQYRLHGTVKNDGRVLMEMSTGACSGGAKWCQTLSSCSSQKTAAFTSNGYFDGQRLVFRQTMATGSGGSSGDCGLNNPFAGWVFVHDGFKPMLPQRPTKQKRPQTALTGTLSYEVPGKPLAVVKSCQFSINPGNGGAWNLASLKCGGTEWARSVGTPRILGRTFEIGPSGNFWFILDGSNFRYLFSGTIGIVNVGTGGIQWLVSGVVADNTSTNYRTIHPAPISPGSVKRADIRGNFYLSN